ncbi:MAG: MBL fold metallo-hydrolase [Thermodesulfobacteriota bacterium]|nr:MBL fold metallo-hydrolase [Thermodesulfobacteriota bacterium]
MKITIIYDNTAWDKSLEADWGFSCLVEAWGKSILFDTGAKGNILLGNMDKLGIDPGKVDEIFISHSHWDHVGGLSDFLRKNPVKVYIPASCPNPGFTDQWIRIKDSLRIHQNIFSTGELKGIEQSLVVKQNGHTVVIAGCSHPGVGEILRAASRHGKVNALIGGLHGFDEFDLIDHMETICPVHCTQYIQKIKALYPEKYMEGGAGKVINL